MKRAFLLISSLMAMGVALPGQTQAAHLSGFCADHDEAVKRLQQRYGERQVAVGLTSGGALLEVLATRTGSSWSVLIVVRAEAREVCRYAATATMSRNGL